MHSKDYETNHLGCLAPAYQLQQPQGFHTLRDNQPTYWYIPTPTTLAKKKKNGHLDYEQNQNTVLITQYQVISSNHDFDKRARTRVREWRFGLRSWDCVTVGARQRQVNDLIEAKSAKGSFLDPSILLWWFRKKKK